MNAAFQKALAAEPLKFLRANEAKLTSKQRQALQQAGKQLVVARVQPSQRGSRVAIPRPKTSGRGVDVNHPMYNEFFAAAHCPRSWPAPRPYFPVFSTGHKYVVSRGCTASVTKTVAAGETCIIYFRPYDRSRPMWTNTTTSGGTVGLAATSLSVSQTTMRTDVSMTGTSGWSVYADANPSSFYEDAATIDSGDNLLTPNLSVHPVMTQMLGGSFQATIMCPYGGSAAVYAVTPGDAPNLVGRHSETLRAGSPAYHDAFRSEVKIPWTNGGSYTPVDIAGAHGRGFLVPGNHTRHVSWSMHGDTGWTWTGTQSTTLAPDASSNLWDRGFTPRNFQSSMQYGYLVVQNTSATDSLSLMFNSKFTFAYVLNQDDAARSVGQLASLMARDAPTMQQHLPPRDIRGMVRPSVVSQDLGASHSSLADFVHKVTGSVKAAESAVADFASKHSTTLELAGLGAMGAGSIWSRAANAAKTVESGVVNVVKGGFSELAPTISKVGAAVEEAGAGALAYAEAAAPYLTGLGEQYLPYLAALA